MTSTCQIGIIGGSGLYDMAGLRPTGRKSALTTPFGDPSGPYVLATLRGRRVAFLARHGAGHRLLPSELNFRANIFGFKLLGVDRFSPRAPWAASGDLPPLDLVVPDQFFDRTKGRISTFFGRGSGRARRLRPSVLLGSSARSRSSGRGGVGARFTEAERMCAWKVRSSRRVAESNALPSGVWTSSA